jgi:acyl-CoA thioesterase YciA
MADRPKGELVIQTIAMPKDTNRDGDIFGGWLVAQMDLGSAILAAKVAKSRVVTVAIEAMSFLNPVRVGDTVACYAWLEKIGRTSMTIPVEVWVHRYKTGEELRVTRGVFTYVAVDAEGKPIPVKRDDASG